MLALDPVLGNDQQVLCPHWETYSVDRHAADSEVTASYHHPTMGGHWPRKRAMIKGKEKGDWRIDAARSGRDGLFLPSLCRSYSS